MSFDALLLAEARGSSYVSSRATVIRKS